MQMWLPFLRRDLGPWSPWARFLRLRARGRRAGLRRDPAPARRAGRRRARRRAVAAARRAPRGRQPDERPRAARRADHAADRRARDQRDRRLRGPSSGCCATPPRCARCSAEVETGGDDYADAVVKETLRVRPVIIDVARLVKADVDLGGWTSARGHDRRAGDRARAADARGVSGARTSSGPSDSSTASPRRTRGSRSAAACGAASARAFAQLEIRTVLQTVLARRPRCAPPIPLRSASACVT